MSEVKAAAESQPRRRCYGVTTEVICNTIWHGRKGMTPKEKLGKMLVGFKHTVRESWQGRAKLSQPDDDKWPFYPPIVGAVLGRQMEVLAVVEEEPRLKGEDQFEFHCIRAPDCGQGELDTDEDLCPKCKSIYELVKRRMEATVDLQKNEFNPKTNRTILERSGSLQKRAVGYHHRESTNLKKKVSRRDRTIC